MKYIAIIPLAGGFALANQNITKNPPEAIFSWKAFYDNDKLYLRYLEQHNINVPYYQIDDENFDFDKITETYKGKINFSCGIPPCSALSMCSQLKPGTRSTYKSVNWLYKSAEFVFKYISPDIHVVENAPGLFTGAGDEVRQRLIKIGEEFGYAITFYKTNTLLHGVPQFRPRTFGIFYKGKYAPILNTYRRIAPHITEYLKQIPKNASLQNEYVVPEWDITKFEIYKYLKKLYGDNWRKVMSDYKFHSTTYEYLQRVNLLDDFQKYQKTLPDASKIVTKNIEHIKRNADEGRGARINYRVLGIDKDYTYAVIGEMMGKQVHPTEDRLMNIREFTHLMGLPMDYELEGQKEYVKISQNVPVKTCEDITTEIIAIINGERQLSMKSVLMQDNTKENNLTKTKALF